MATTKKQVKKQAKKVKQVKNNDRVSEYLQIFCSTTATGQLYSQLADSWQENSSFFPVYDQSQNDLNTLSSWCNIMRQDKFTVVVKSLEFFGCSEPAEKLQAFQRAVINRRKALKVSSSDTELDF